MATYSGLSPAVECFTGGRPFQVGVGLEARDIIAMNVLASAEQRSFWSLSLRRNSPRDLKLNARTRALPSPCRMPQHRSPRSFGPKTECPPLAAPNRCEVPSISGTRAEDYNDVDPSVNGALQGGPRRAISNESLILPSGRSHGLDRSRRVGSALGDGSADREDLVDRQRPARRESEKLQK